MLTINDSRFPIEEMFEEGLSRPRVRRGKKKSPTAPPERTLVPLDIKPKTANQERAFAVFASGKHLLAHGVSGTGKTLLACYMAIRAVMTPGSRYSKVIIVRSSVSSRDQGHMPGGPRDKASVYEAPYHGHFSDIFGRDDAYSVLKQKRIVEFITTSFVRGTNVTGSIVIVDEMQNMTDMELHTVITRLGKDTRLILCGDYRQDDLTGKKGETSGLKNIFQILSSMRSVGTVEFGIQDVVRSGFVKEYLLKRNELGIDPPSM